MPPAQLGGMRISPSVLMLAGCMLVGCSGQIEEPTGREDGPGELRGEDGAGETSTPPAPELTVTNERLRLLPFSVRLARVAAVTGVAEDDPILSELHRRAIDLGAADFANGIAPDPIWSSTKMSVWVDALQPVCGSEAMRTRYPSFPESLPAFVQAAYGRHATAEDTAALEPVLSATAIDEERRYVLACTVLLSAAEMVLQ